MSTASLHVRRPRPALTLGERVAVFATALLVFSSTACHSGGGGGATQELEVTGLEVVSQSPQLGHDLALVVELSAARATSEASVALFLANAAEVDAGAPEPTLSLLAACAIADVQAGDHEYTLRCEVDEDTLVAGNYYLFAVADPLGAMPETDEANDAPSSDEIASVGVLMTLSGANQAIADLVFESVTLDDPLVEVDVTPSTYPAVGAIAEVPNGEFGLTATVRSSGPDQIANVHLSAFVQVPGLSLLSLLFWNSSTKTYTPDLVVPSLTAGEPTVVHVDAIVSPSGRGDLGNFLAGRPSLMSSARMLMVLDPTNTIPEYEDGILLDADGDGSDNVGTEPFFLRTFSVDPRAGAGTGGLDWDVPFVKGFSNGNVGVGVHLGATANVGTKGLHAQASASVPMTLLGSTFDLLNLDATGLFNPLHAADNGFVVTLKGLNTKLYERRTKEDQALDSPPLSFALEQAVSSTFTVGPVPMFVRLGARGTVGLDVNASVGSALTIEAVPSLAFSVFGEGGPGASFAGWTLGGGLGANLTLVDERFRAAVSASSQFDSGTSHFSGTLTEQVTNELQGPSGRAFLFVTAEGKILWKPISQRWEHVLASWQPFSKTDTLFNQTQPFGVTLP